MSILNESELTSLTVEQFLIVINGGNDQPWALEYYQTDEFSGTKTIKFKHLIIKASTADDNRVLRVKGLQLPSLVFLNCVIEPALEFDHCVFEGELTFHSSLLKNSLEINYCSARSNIQLVRTRVEVYTTIDSLICDAELAFRESKLGQLWLMDTELKDSFNIIKSGFTGNFNAKKLKVLGYFHVVASQFDKDFEIYEGSFEKGFSLHASSVDQTVRLVGASEFSGESGISESNMDTILIESAQFTDVFGLADNKIRKQLVFKDSGMKKARISGGQSCINEIVFEQRTVQTVDVWNITKLNSVVFDKAILHKESVIVFNQCVILSVKFNSFLNLGNLAFVELRPSLVLHRLEWITNEEGNSAFSLQSLAAPSLFSILNSDLGRTQLINCDLGHYNRFEFVSSRIVDAFLAGTQMPERISVPEAGERTYDVLNEERISYAQFKKNAEGRGDSVGALYYLNKELSAYRKWLARNQSGNLGERVNLWLNEKSNQYGTNWSRAALTGFLLWILLFVIYCLAYGYRPGGNLSLFFELASNMPEFLNPIRKSDILKDVSIQPPTTNPVLARFLDYFSRIAISYFVYQMVQAFRKYGKK